MLRRLRTPLDKSLAAIWTTMACVTAQNILSLAQPFLPKVLQENMRDITYTAEHEVTPLCDRPLARTAPTQVVEKTQ